MQTFKKERHFAKFGYIYTSFFMFLVIIISFLGTYFPDFLISLGIENTILFCFISSCIFIIFALFINSFTSYSKGLISLQQRGLLSKELLKKTNKIKF